MSANFNIVDLLKRQQPRQPWDERTATGQSVPDLLRRQSSVPAVQQAALGVPNGDIVELLKRQPQPAVTGMPEPPPTDGRAIPTQMPQVRVGTDTRGLDPLQRQQAKVDLLRQAPVSSKIHDSGDFIEQGPPEQSPSRVKNALLGLLLGTAQGGLPGGIAGAGVGAIKPEAIQQLLRDRQVAKEEDRLGRQIGLESKGIGLETDRAQLDLLRGQPELLRQKAEREAKYNNARLEIQRQAELGRITRAEAERRQRELDRKSREGIAAERIASSEKIAASRPNSAAANTAKREAKINESSALYKKAEAADAEAAKLDGYIKNLRDGLASLTYEDVKNPSESHGPTEQQVKDYNAQIEDLQKQQRKLHDDANDLRVKGDAARAAGESVPESSSAQPYAGRTMSRANLEKYAKAKGLTVEEAQKDVESKGVRVQ